MKTGEERVKSEIDCHMAAVKSLDKSSATGSEMAIPKTVCTSCGDIIDESDDQCRPDPAWKINGQPKCKDCYLELACGRIVAPGQTHKPPHENLTPRQRTKLN